MDKLRGLWYEPRFEEEAARIEPDAEQWDDIFRGVEWQLARDPRSGERVGWTDVWAIPTRPFVNRREEVVYLTFYYRFDDDSVTLLSVTQTVLDW